MSTELAYAPAPATASEGASEAAVYEHSTRIRYSETTSDGRLSLPALIDAFQDCSIFQSEAVGFGPERLQREHTAWVLSHWHVVVERFPRLGENVTVGTFASRFRAVTAHRNFYLRDAAGAIIARADSMWGFIDLAAGKPLRPTPEHIAAYGMRPPLEMPAAARKIAVPSEREACEPLAVSRHHIDTNNHVNNCHYVRMALDVLPDEAKANTLRVDYRKAAVLGDIIHPYLAQEPDRFVVELCDAKGDAFGVVELRDERESSSGIASKNE